MNQRFNNVIDRFVNKHIINFIIVFLSGKKNLSRGITAKVHEFMTLISTETPISRLIILGLSTFTQGHEGCMMENKEIVV